MSLKIVHVSDMHGHIPSRWVLDGVNPDLIVLSGDLFPNRTRGVRDIEESFQSGWLRGTEYHRVNALYSGHLTPLERWLDFLGDVPVISVGGNHDYTVLTDHLKGFRGNALTHDLIVDGDISLSGMLFVGLSLIPYINGEWNNETMPTDLRHATYDVFDKNPDVIVSHSPPSGILSGPYGSDVLTNCLSYREHKVKAVLFGHAHEDGGNTLVESLNGDVQTIFSNAACSVNIVEIPT